MRAFRPWLLGLMLVFSGCNSPESFLVEGNRAYARGDRQAAGAAYSQAVKHARTEAVAHLNLGRLYLEAGQHQVAKTHLDQGLTLRPDLAAGYLYRGRAQAALGDTAAAEKDLAKAVALDRHDEDAWLELARVRASRGRLVEALRALEYPKNSPAYQAEATFLGLEIRRRMGQTDGSLAELEALAQSQPYLARAYFELGNLYLDQKDFREAARRLTQGLSLEPGDRSARLALARCQEGLGRWSEATREYQAVIDGAPPEGDALTAQARGALARRPVERESPP